MALLNAKFLSSSMALRRLFRPAGGRPSYEREITLFLSFMRFAGIAVAAGLAGILFVEELDEPGVLLVFGPLGAYSVLKILAPTSQWQSDIVTYMVLLGDLVICATLVQFTGGIYSPFLLYSLLPLATAALLADRRISLLMAALTSLNLILAETALAGVTPVFGLASGSRSITAIASFCIFSLIIASITYPSNLNVSRRIENKAIVDERRRLRQEIHDGIAQVVGYVKMKTELLKKDLPPSAEKLRAELDEIYHVLSESSAELRQAIDSLDVKHNPLSLVDSLSSYTQKAGQKTGCHIEFTAPPELPALNQAVQLQLLRIAQEALTNVRKHAAATQISVKLESLPQGIELVVRDNGRGFCPAERKGVGLGVMEERVASIGGVLTVDSSPGKGTEVRVRVPKRRRHGAN